MRVLLTATVQSHICQFHRPLADMLHEHGAEVHVAARDNLAEKNGLKLDFADEVFNVPFSRSPISTDNIKAFKQLKQIIDEGDYDIIHCNTPVGGVVTRLAAKKARKRGAKVFYTAHGFHFYKGASWKNWLAFYPIERLMARKTDRLITINTEDFEFAKRKFSCEVRYIHGVGVDAGRFSIPTGKESRRIRQELGFTASQPVILCIGELLPNKNQQMAICAMVDVCKQYPDAMLLLAGNGPEEENLRQLIADLNLQNNIKLLGYCMCLEKFQKCANALVACSKREGLPLNVLEAQLSGVPVIASDNRGHRDLIESAISGFIVPAGDFKKMSEAINSILSNDTMAKLLAHNAYSKARLYSSGNVKQELQTVYGLE